MAYVNYDYFLTAYKGSVEIAEEEFEYISERASDVIDQITGYKIAKAGLESFSGFDQTAIMKAVCAQIEHLFYQGIENAVSGGSDGSYNIGNTSITRAVGTGGAASGAAVRISPMAKALLIPTGLLYRGGVAVC